MKNAHRPAFGFWQRCRQQKAGRFLFVAVLFLAGFAFAAAAAESRATPAPKKTPTQLQAPKPAQPSAPTQTVQISARSVYKLVPEQKSLAASPQFLLIDDFNSPEWKSKREGIWFLRGAKAGEIKVSRTREDSRNPLFGSSLKIDFNLPKNREFSFKSSLEKLDMSQADALVFSCKSFYPRRVQFAGSIRLVLEDWRGKQALADITSSCSGTNWSEIILPRDTFRDLDWDQLNTMTFMLVSGGQKAEGFLQIDEIAFYGANEVYFESHLDNLNGFPKTVFAEKRREKLLKIKKDNELLREIAADTWKYFDNAYNPANSMIVDHIRLGDAPLAGDYTSPTNLAMDLLATIAAEKMKLITRADALERVARRLQTIEHLRRWRNLYYNFYETNKLSVTRGYVSSVDNGWLGIALVVARQAFDKQLYREATKILNRMDFSEFLDYDNNQLSLGFDSEKNELVRTHYGMLISEARATSLFGIGKGDLPEDHWWSLYRTPPNSWNWQNQKPKGHEVEHGGMIYFQGHYQYDDLEIVPSWGGSLFEFLMPDLVLNEKKYAPESFGKNNERAVQAHKNHAMKEGYPVWGLSPAATTNGRTWKYGEYGVKQIGVKGYPDMAVVTPHVSFLALGAAPKEAIANIRKWLTFNVYGEYGFYDSLQVKTGKVNTQYLALDQGMSFIALANFLEEGYIQTLFHQDPIGQKALELWKQERFFKD